MPPFSLPLPPPVPDVIEWMYNTKLPSFSPPLSGLNVVLAGCHGSGITALANALYSTSSVGATTAVPHFVEGDRTRTVVRCFTHFQATHRGCPLNIIDTPSATVSGNDIENYRDNTPECVIKGLADGQDLTQMVSLRGIVEGGQGVLIKSAAILIFVIDGARWTEPDAQVKYFQKYIDASVSFNIPRIYVFTKLDRLHPDIQPENVYSDPRTMQLRAQVARLYRAPIRDVFFSQRYTGSPAKNPINIYLLKEVFRRSLLYIDSVHAGLYSNYPGCSSEDPKCKCVPVADQEDSLNISSSRLNEV